MLSTKQKPYKITKIDYDLYSMEYGDYGIFHKNKGHSTWIEWIPCREVFQEESSSLRCFLFYIARENIANTKAFIKRIEKLIKLPVKKRLRIRRTTNKNIIYVSLSDFWRSLVHRSLLTILLRAGENYDRNKDNWKKVIEADKYLKKTKEAINRFLEGYTRPMLHYNKNKDEDDVNAVICFSGWCSEFAHNNAKEVARKLVK